MINQNSPEYEKETVILAQIDLTTGSIPKTLLRFAFPMICGNLLQQLYNVADTLIVGRFLGSDALGAVGSSYTLMTFLTSILLGLCMGSGALFSVCWGQRDLARLRRQTHAAFVLIAVCTVVLNAAAFLLLDAMKTLLSVPAEVWPLMRSYLFVIFLGIGGTFLYNYYASLLRAVGNSLVPLLFLAAAAVLNIALDLVFVLDWCVAHFPAPSEQEDEGEVINVAIIGKPNVGKSSLLNRILGQERVIVSNVAGTTRDAIDSYFENEFGKYRFIDTAGMRRKSKVDDAIEKYSNLRSIAAIERADVCLILIDAVEGVTEQDTKIAGLAHEAGKASIIVVNKWDLVDKDTNTMAEKTAEIRRDLSYLTYAPIIFLSALTGQRVGATTVAT